MTNGSERFERIERILEQVAVSLQEKAARWRYHDEAFERHDTENMRSLVGLAEGGEPV